MGDNSVLIFAKYPYYQVNMDTSSSSVGYRIWGADKAMYGPVELPTLITWVQQHRVTAQTWVYSEREDNWRPASELPELRMFFGPQGGSVSTARSGAKVSEPTAVHAVPPASLRRVKILASFTDEQLLRFVEYMEVMRVQAWTELVRQGDPGNAMYLVLSGELRVRTMISGKETILATLGPGDFCGEISLFDQGPRSADVVCNEPSLLLKISLTAFERLLREAPELAAPFLHAVGKTLTARIRADNQRHRNAVQFVRNPSPNEEVGGARA